MEEVDLLQPIRERSGLLLGVGIVQMIVGAVAIAAPLVATLASAVVLGWLLLLSGVLQIVHAFQVGRWQGFVLHVLGGVFFAAGGLLVVFRPMTGALSLTLVLAAFFVVEGVSRTMLALRMRGARGWGVFLAGGVLGLLLGVMLWAEWPDSALWAVGLLVGINLVFGGSSLVAVALAARRPAPA